MMGYCMHDGLLVSKECIVPARTPFHMFTQAHLYNYRYIYVCSYLYIHTFGHITLTGDDMGAAVADLQDYARGRHD